MKQTPQILQGGPIADRILNELASQISQQTDKPPLTLAVVVVGNDPASAVYVLKKQMVCKQIGIRSIRIDLPESTTQEELLERLAHLNDDATVQGILVQLPLPEHIDSTVVFQSIDPKKDVDCFHPLNVGRLSLGTPTFVPCTPAGIIALLDAYDIPLEGKECVVIGKSNIVGKPLIQLLLNRGATVTVCHSKTQNVKTHCLRADVLVAAAGKPGLVQADMLSSGVTVVDVGINRLPSGKLVGDVAADAYKSAGAITPVPGGVGPMTIAMLMRNIVSTTLR